jgi:tryptophan synthase beta subunit
MPKARRLVKSIKEWKLSEKEEELEKEYVKRIHNVIGQLNSAKKLSKGKKLLLYNEMYSAQQAIGSARSKIKLDMVVGIIRQIKRRKYADAVLLAESLFELLNRKDFH